MPFPFKELIDRLMLYYRNEVPIVTRIAGEQRDPFLVLIGCLLSLRTKDAVTDMAMSRLMKRARTPSEIIKIPTEELQEIIYPVGFFRNKSVLLKEVSRTLIDRFGGSVPDTMEELLSIKGVGRKTANIVITDGFGKAGIAVDTHVHRISNRLGIVSTRTPDQTEDRLRAVLPKEYWMIFNRLLVTHGQKTCSPISPFCSRCPVFSLCARVGVTKSR